VKRGKWIDSVLTVLANLGMTVPVFWLGILMIYVFSLQLHWLPVFGYTSPFEDPWRSLQQMIMPVFCLATTGMATMARQTRSSMLEVIRQDYIRTAWAKGLRERDIISRHAVKNAFIPVITLMGMHVRYIFGGSVLIETVFSIPGMGRLMITGILSQDYQVVQAAALILAIVVMVANLAVDISYAWFDPRIHYD
jgi:peptide/nickel transport system permease protein